MAVDSANSQSSGVTGGDLPGFFDQDEVSNLECLEKEAMFSEWTDEKHSLYLKSIENSFVQQLYSSIESSCFHSHKKHCLNMRSFEQNKSHPADQIKVHQHSFWQGIKIGRGEPPPKKAGKSRLPLQTPWIQHFRSRDNSLSDDFHIYQTIGDSNTDQDSWHGGISCVIIYEFHLVLAILACSTLRKISIDDLDDHFMNLNDSLPLPKIIGYV